MQPLNPFLTAFFKSNLPSQCSPIQNHVLLVPTTRVLLISRDTDSGQTYTDLLSSSSSSVEEFLASHVLRVHSNTALILNSHNTLNLREIRGKAKQYSTHNGRSVVLKDAFIYTGKGFRTPTQAQLLYDAVWHTDTIDSKQWLIYYISCPLIGTVEEIFIEPAIIIPDVRKIKPDATSTTATASTSTRPTTSPKPDANVNGSPHKKDIKNFHDLINNFPLIARQMQPGLEKLFREFTLAIQRPLPPPPSAAHIPDPEPDGPITSAAKKARSNSIRVTNGHAIASAIAGSGAGLSTSADTSPGARVDAASASAIATASTSKGPPSASAAPNDPHGIFPEDGEDVMRASLETAVMTAIDIFQAVDKQQLSLLGATTDLTGPVVERIIERYVTENIHHLVFPRLIALRRQEDIELEQKIRKMDHVDISQLGIFILGGPRGKHGLTLGLGKAVDEFRKMNTVMGPHEMIDLLLSTLKSVAQLTDSPKSGTNTDGVPEKPILTVNADTLVSLLLYVVIRAGVRYLLARLGYMRGFVFVMDVERGETGYAVSTFEAVLAYLGRDSAGLRRASRRNKALWDAAAMGDVGDLRKIMEPGGEQDVDDDEEEDEGPLEEVVARGRSISLSSFASRSSRESVGSSFGLTLSERFSQGSDLSHVFPFQNREGEWDGVEGDGVLPLVVPKRVKRVAMDTRSMSSGSEMSFHSRAASVATIGSLLEVEGDTSIERLSQTQNSFGESVVMMAIQNSRTEALKYLLPLQEYFPLRFVLEDCNHEETTLLSAAVQLGEMALIEVVLDHLFKWADAAQLERYFGLQDIWGRSVGHYLFHAPGLIQRIGSMIPWRQRDKNGQTPLFALCRSYDHADYHAMVDAGLATARAAQMDGCPLHLDQHIDAKGNSLLHVVNDPGLAYKMLAGCDVDVNATNEKRFTALMVASKYGRFGMVKVLYGDPRTDLGARELRGLTAVELAKDDEVRNRIDDLTLFVMPPGKDGRITGVVRSFFVEDATIRLVIKSGPPAPRGGGSYSVTTCRRSLGDFEHLASLLAMENPASWIPSVTGLRSPFQIPSKPSRAVLRDIQVRLDWFLKILLLHPTFGTHEMLWEFFLAPEIQPEMMEQRSRAKARAREENVREEMEPVEDVREVELFVEHAREMIRGAGVGTKSVARRCCAVGVVAGDLHDASALLTRAVSTLPFLPQTHISALETWTRTLSPPQSNPHTTLHTTLLALQSTIQALLLSLAKPPQLIAQIAAAKRNVERSYNSLSRTSRWGPLALLDDGGAREEEKLEKVRLGKRVVEDLGRELRFSQQVVAGELAGWQDVHARVGKRAVVEFARGMVTGERVRLEGLRRALRVLREGSGGRDRGGDGGKAAEGGVGVGNWDSRGESAGSSSSSSSSSSDVGGGCGGRRRNGIGGGENGGLFGEMDDDELDDGGVGGSGDGLRSAGESLSSGVVGLGPG